MLPGEVHSTVAASQLRWFGGSILVVARCIAHRRPLTMDTMDMQLRAAAATTTTLMIMTAERRGGDGEGPVVLDG